MPTVYLPILASFFQGDKDACVVALPSMSLGVVVPLLEVRLQSTVTVAPHVFYNHDYGVFEVHV